MVVRRLMLLIFVRLVARAERLSQGAVVARRGGHAVLTQKNRSNFSR